MPNITTNHDITCTNFGCNLEFLCIVVSIPKILGFLSLWNGHVEIFSPPQAIENSRQFLLLRTNRFFTELLNSRWGSCLQFQKRPLNYHIYVPVRIKCLSCKGQRYKCSPPCTQCFLTPKLKGVEVLVIWTSWKCAQNRLTTLKLHINRSTLKDIVSLHRTASN